MYNSIYPINIKPYVPPYVKKNGGKGNAGVDEQEENTKSSQESNNNTSSNTTDPNGGRKNNYGPQEFPNGQKTTIDYSKSKVNIAQILTDFRSTANAIGTPPTILNEVEQYLAISEAESLKAEPNKKRIQSNLRNASNILDEFISKTLDKKSKVVENWIDALFLQKVDYKSDPSTINPDFLVKLPDKETGAMKPISQGLTQQEQASAVNTAPEQAEAVTAQPATPSVTSEVATKEVSEETPIVQAQVQESEQTPIAATETDKVTPKSYMPENAEIKSALIAGKRLLSVGEKEKAIASFQSAIELSMMYGDNNAEGIACFELAKIFDKDDNLDEALKYYNQAHLATSDNNLKARAYYNMARIYDDVVYFGPAMEHYYAAIAYAGAAENLNAQIKALTDIGDMYADRYDVDNTYAYYKIAKNIALETKNDKTCGSVWLKSADSLAVVNENANALADYKTSSKYYEKAQNPIKIAQNYEKAAEIMLRLGNSDRANSLFAKAKKFAQQANQDELAKTIEQSLID